LRLGPGNFHVLCGKRKSNRKSCSTISVVAQYGAQKSGVLEGRGNDPMPKREHFSDMHLACNAAAGLVTAKRCVTAFGGPVAVV